MSKKKAPPARADSTPNVARLRVIKGPHKGVAYKLLAEKVTIGRSSDNDIILIKDEKCSRRQAMISLNVNNNYFIKDLSNRSSIKVNNMVKIQSDLQDGDLIQFGSSVLRFEFTTDKTTAPPAPSSAGAPSLLPAQPGQSSPSPLAPLPVMTPATPTPDDHLPGLKQENPLPNLNPVEGFPAPPAPPAHPLASSTGPQTNRRKKTKSFVPRLILIAIVLGGVWLFLDDSGPQKKQEDALRTNLEREDSIKTLSELKEQELEKRSKNALSSYKHAQSAYTKGIRDYRKGVYNRAIESFRACKTLYPQHELCASYLKKAEIKNQQIIQAWMIAGKEYREKRRFVPCMSSFKNVMIALRDKNNLAYKEAHENWKICQIQHEDRY